MIQQISLKLLPHEAGQHKAVAKHAAASLGVRPADVSGFNLLKRSIDARP